STGFRRAVADRGPQRPASPRVIILGALDSTPTVVDAITTNRIRTARLRAFVKQLQPLHRWEWTDGIVITVDLQRCQVAVLEKDQQAAEWITVGSNNGRLVRDRAAGA